MLQKQTKETESRRQIEKWKQKEKDRKIEDMWNSRWQMANGKNHEEPQPKIELPQKNIKTTKEERGRKALKGTLQLSIILLATALTGYGAEKLRLVRPMQYPGMCDASAGAAVSSNLF